MWGCISPLAADRHCACSALHYLCCLPPLPACLQITATTNSGSLRCRVTVLLDAQGNPTVERALHDESELNILTQWLLCMGLNDGVSRSLSQRNLELLLCNPEDFLMGVLAGIVETDGTRQKSNNYLLVTQGRLCGHDMLVGAASGCVGGGWLCITGRQRLQAAPLGSRYQQIAAGSRPITTALPCPHLLNPPCRRLPPA